MRHDCPLVERERTLFLPNGRKSGLSDMLKLRQIIDSNIDFTQTHDNWNKKFGRTGSLFIPGSHCLCSSL